MRESMNECGVARADGSSYSGEKDTLSADERALVETGLAEHERDPHSPRSWKEFEARD
jgi:hypothetical protein